MNMKFIFSTQDLTQGLHVSLTGNAFVLTGFTDGKTVSIEEVAGQVTVSISGVDAIQPVIDQVSQVEPVQQQVQALHTVPADVQHSAKPDIPAVPFLDQLFTDLVALRRKISSEVNLPPYMIFHDATLKEMCRVLPSELSDLKEIAGVGSSKLTKYGSRFLEIIQQYLSESEVLGA